VVIDTIRFVRGILETEVNSTLDNPVCHLHAASGNGNLVRIS